MRHGNGAGAGREGAGWHRRDGAEQAWTGQDGHRAGLARDRTGEAGGAVGWRGVRGRGRGGCGVVWGMVAGGETAMVGVGVEWGLDVEVVRGWGY
ncbi:hypothetical protein GCM10022221_20990 [Actinocorallia aurea]